MSRNKPLIKFVFNMKDSLIKFRKVKASLNLPLHLLKNKTKSLLNVKGIGSSKKSKVQITLKRALVVMRE